MIHSRSVQGTPIFQKTYDLYKLFDNLHQKIPKSRRYSLWLRCENTALAMLEGLIAVGYLKEREIIEALYKVSHTLDLFKMYIRLTKETHLIDPKQYIQIETILQEIGRMIGGWIKSVSPPIK